MNAIRMTCICSGAWMHCDAQRKLDGTGQELALACADSYAAAIEPFNIEQLSSHTRQCSRRRNDRLRQVSRPSVTGLNAQVRNHGGKLLLTRGSGGPRWVVVEDSDSRCRPVSDDRLRPLQDCNAPAGREAFTYRRAARHRQAIEAEHGTDEGGGSRSLQTQSQNVAECRRGWAAIQNGRRSVCATGTWSSVGEQAIWLPLPR